MVGLDGRAVPKVAHIDWEEVACPLCSASKEELLLEKHSDEDRATYRLVRCGACGLGYLNPRPNLASIAQFYPLDYECYAAPRPRRRSWWKECRRRLERLVLAHSYGYPPAPEHWAAKALARLARPWFGPGRDSMTALPYLGQGKLLDYGCGSGWFARRMQERGWNVTGMDFNAEAAAQVASRFGFPVLTGTLPHPRVEPESFDLITMGAVLEHVHWPHPLIAGAVRALRPGGMLAISVPNLESWQFRRFGPDCWSLELPRHLLHFSPSTLRQLVTTHGLEVCEVRILGRTSWMRRSLATARRRPQSYGVFLPLARLPLVPSLLTRWTAWTQQADCMMIVARKPALTLHTPRKCSASLRIPSSIDTVGA